MQIQGQLNFMHNLLTFLISSSISNLAFVGYNPIRGSLDKHEVDFNFELKAYKDSARLQLITSQSGIDLGEVVYNSIRPIAPLPNSVDYQITSCTAYERKYYYF